MLDERSIRSSEDAFMDLLVEAAPGLGAPLLAAEYPRAYIDLNRSDEELDPGVIEGVGRVVQTPRISSRARRHPAGRGQRARDLSRQACPGGGR
jgi:N-formylglutamate amidohydrolase